MKCAQCEAQAIAICDRCFVGQCEKHLGEDMRGRAASIGYLLAGCTHRTLKAERAE